MNMKSFVISDGAPYCECLVDDGMVNKFYEIQNNGMNMTAVPDACVDLQFVVEDGTCTVYACGSFLEGAQSPTGQYANCFGVKFNPGVIPNGIQGGVKEIINGRSSFAAGDGLRRLCEEICAAKDFEAKIDAFQKHFSYEKQICTGNDLVAFAIAKIRDEMGYVNISQLTQSMGYNQKYVDRVFKNFVGMSLKKYAIIMRVQEAIQFLQNDKVDEVYNCLHYYDQAHFIRDFKRYTCLTPNQYVNHNNHKRIV